MSDKPDDRLKPVEVEEEAGEPQIYAVVDGKQLMRPGLETFFVDPMKMKSEKTIAGCACDPVAVTYCSCNKVAACSCVGHRSCKCVGHRSSGGYRTGCRCAPVH